MRGPDKKPRKRQQIPLEERLWSRIQVGEKEECWPWIGHTNHAGYGMIGVGKRGEGMRLAHRIVFTLFNGPIPAGQLCCHSCDNRRCCNPAHLWLGTHADNTNDARKKDRFRTEKRRLAGLRQRGENHPMAKLTAQDVSEIRKLLAAGLSCQAIANRFNVTRTSVSGIKLGKNWKRTHGELKAASEL